MVLLRDVVKQVLLRLLSLDEFEIEDVASIELQLEVGDNSCNE